ncbi:MAG TPA: hypothetical protein VK906_10670 [Egicoccus sp.]|nr:hypothetical protein [Egicoccus sp.]HSK23632.1 hypothetical protein [Egicoccus sp.]
MSGTTSRWSAVGRVFGALRQAWTGDRSEHRRASHLFVPSRGSIVTCAACGRTEGEGDHDGSALNNQNSVI